MQLPSELVARLRPRLRGRDPRLIVGIVLVAFSTLLGIRLLQSAGDRTSVWQVTRDLAAGTELTASDVRPVAVHLASAADRYAVARGAPPSGQRLAVEVRAGELLPTAALATAQPRRRITVAVDTDRLPAGLRPGQLVDAYVTPKDEAQPARLVQEAVLVGAVGDTGGTQVAIGLDVAPEQVAAIVSAVRSGQVDLVGRS